MQYTHGGKGLEKEICNLVNDLQGRETDDGSRWGPMGLPVKTMDWAEICLWLELMGVPEEAVDVQRENQFSGLAYDDAVQSSRTDVAIDKIQEMLHVHRKCALRLVMNIQFRSKKLNIVSGERKPLNAANDLIHIIEHMNTVGFGRYHGAEIFSSKFSKNKGLETLLQIVNDGEEETCILALRALRLIGDTSEEKPSESSHDEAMQRFEKRKLIVKDGGVNTLLQVIRNRSPDPQELALHVLQTVTSFPGYWVSWSGENMNLHYKTAAEELLNGGIEIIIDTLKKSSSSIVCSKCIQILQELMIHDDRETDRNCTKLLDGSFFLASAPRSKVRERKSSRPSSGETKGMASSANNSRKGARQANSSRSARQAIADNGGVTVLSERIKSSATSGTLKISNIFAKQLPRVDRMGASDPFCRIFLESKEFKTETIYDTSQPEWTEEFVVEVEDVASATLVILIYDEDDNDVFTFMSMASIPLAELVHSAEDSNEDSTFESLRYGKETATELLSKFSKGAREAPIRIGDQIISDAWVELRERNGKKPNLLGVLGFLHLTLDLVTEYRHRLDLLQVRASALGALHLFCANEYYRSNCILQRDLVQPTIRLMYSWNEDAQSNAASFLGDLAFEASNVESIIHLEGIEALIQSFDFGSADTKLQAAEALALLAFNHRVRDRIFKLKGHVGASAKDGLGVIEDLLRDDTTNEDVAAAAISLCINMCLDDFRIRERIVKGITCVELVRGIARFGGNFRAEATCLLALLAEPLDNRLALSRVVARHGEESLGVVSALSLALCSTDTVTDARSLTGAADARAAASNALCFMSEFGGLDEVVNVIRFGSETLKAEAAKTLGNIAAIHKDKNLVISTGVVPNLVEIILSSSSPEARINAAATLARISEDGELEIASEVRSRIRCVCKIIPSFGVTPVDSVINVLLRSSDEEQRCVAAWALSTWCLMEDYAATIWQEGSENLIDIMLGSADMNPEGVYFSIRLLCRACSFESLKHTVGSFQFLYDGGVRSTLKALRHVLRVSVESATIEGAAHVLQLLAQHGGLEELTDVVLSEDGDAFCLKVCASALQPLCAKEEYRRRVAKCAGKDIMQVSMWLSEYVLVDTHL